MAESVAKKELSLTLKFGADTAAGRAALQALGADLAKLEQQAGRAQAALRPGVGATGGTGLGVGGLARGAAGAALGAAGSVAGWLAAAGVVVQTAANMTTAFQAQSNAMLSTREKALEFAKAIPIVGTALAGLVSSSLDAIDRLNDPGAAKRVDRARIENPILMAQMEAGQGYRMRGAGLAGEARDAGLRLDAVRANPSLAAQGAALGMFGGVGGVFARGLYGEDNPLLGSMEAVQAARREADFAGRAAAASAAGVASAQGRSDSAEYARKEAANLAAAARLRAGVGAGDNSAPDERPFEYYARMRAGGRSRGGAALEMFGEAFARQGRADPGSNLAQEDALQKEQMADLRARHANLELEAKITTNKERQLEYARKLYDVSKAETQLLKDRRSRLDQDRDRVKGGAQSFAAMGGISQMALVNAARRFKEGGREAVSAEEFGLLTGNAITSKFVGERLDKDVGGNRDYQELLKITGEKKIEDIERERVKLKTEIDMKVQLDEEQFARTLAETLKKINIKELFEGVFKREVEASLRRPEAESARGRVERG